MFGIIVIAFFSVVGWLNVNLPMETIIDMAPAKAEEEIVVRKVAKKIECNLTAKSGLVIDLASGQELCSKEPDKVLPTASLTKLISTLVFLDHNPGWETIYRVRPTDRRNGGRIYLFSGDEVTAKDLFYNSLIASDNTAVIGLVNLTNMTEGDFIKEMNAKVRELGLFKTVFVEPTGLSNKNRSTAREVAVFASLALNTPEIREAVLQSQHTFTTKQGKTRTVHSTGQPLASQLSGLDFLGGKTGYLADVGYSFVGLFEQGDRQLITVVLGASSRDDRFAQTAKLLNGYSTYYQ